MSVQSVWEDVLPIPAACHPLSRFYADGRCYLGIVTPRLVFSTSGGNVLDGLTLPLKGPGAGAYLG